MHNDFLGLKIRWRLILWASGTSIFSRSNESMDCLQATLLFSPFPEGLSSNPSSPVVPSAPKVPPCSFRSGRPSIFNCCRSDRFKLMIELSRVHLNCIKFYWLMHSFFHERIQSEIPSLHQMKCQLITRLYNERSLFWEFIRPTY